MKAYKGFDKNMQCRGFQYEEGKTYELPDGEEAKLCESGFHACEAPLDCFRYYYPGNSVFHEVDLDTTEEVGSDDSKRVGRKITIGAKLDVAGIVKAQFEYTKEHCTNENHGADKSALNGGDWSALNGGDRSALNGGDWSALNGGNRSALNGGDRSALNGGYWSALNGGYWSALNGGDRSALNGGYGSALNGGDWSALNGGNRSALNGGNGSVIRGGIGSKFKGGKWAVFACEVRDSDYNLTGMVTAVVDGESIKADTWYTLKDGEFVEVNGGADND